MVFPQWTQWASLIALREPPTVCWKVRRHSGQAIENVRHSRGIVVVSLNPEGCRGGWRAGRQPFRLGEPCDDPQQGPDATALLVKGIGGNSGRHLIAGKCAAHRDYTNRGKTAVDHRRHQAQSRQIDRRYPASGAGRGSAGEGQDRECMG